MGSSGLTPIGNHNRQYITMPVRHQVLVLCLLAPVSLCGVCQVASYSSSCDIWSLGVILLELCLPQKAPRPHRWNFAFVMHAVGRAAFQMEFMVLENILKVLGRPKEQEQVLDMTKYDEYPPNYLSVAAALDFGRRCCCWFCCCSSGC